MRLLLALTAACRLHSDHFDIKSAFVHENYGYTKPVLIKQLPKFDGTLRHPGKPAGVLMRNIYGTPSGGYYYLKGAEACLKAQGFNQSNDDPCLFAKFEGPDAFTILALTIDDFLIVATHKERIDDLFQALNAKYKEHVKRLDPPSQYLGWRIEHKADGAIKISQPSYISKALQTMRMADCNGRPCPWWKACGITGRTTQTPRFLNIRPSTRR